MPPISNSPPATSEMTATVWMIGRVAPALTSASTPTEPSVFMMTMAQSPVETCQVSVRGPVPESDAAQNVCAAGSAAGSPPGCAV
jgi:hypothetical protein